MSTYTTEELLNLWARGEITVEQSIGQLMQHLSTLYGRLVFLERRLSSLSSDTGSLHTQSKFQHRGKTKKKPS